MHAPTGWSTQRMLALEFQLYGLGTVPSPASFTEQGPFSTNRAARVCGCVWRLIKLGGVEGTYTCNAACPSRTQDRGAAGPAGQPDDDGVVGGVSARLEVPVEVFF